MWWKLLGFTVLMTFIYDMEECSSFWWMWNRMRVRGESSLALYQPPISPSFPILCHPCTVRKICQKHLLRLLTSISRVWCFVTPRTVARQVPLSMGFSRHEPWSGLPFPSPGDLPDLGIEPVSPTLQADALPSEPQSDYKHLKVWLPSLSTQGQGGP